MSTKTELKCVSRGQGRIDDEEEEEDEDEDEDEVEHAPDGWL